MKTALREFFHAVLAGLRRSPGVFHAPLIGAIKGANKAMDVALSGDNHENHGQPAH
jgi:hypothetical protein